MFQAASSLTSQLPYRGGTTLKSSFIQHARTPQQWAQSGGTLQALTGAMGALAFCVLSPWLVRYGSDTSVIEVIGARNDLIGTALSVLLGTFFMRRLAGYPGARATSYILPVFSASYGFVLTIFFFIRFDYGRFQFAASFITCLLWAYAARFIIARQRKRRLAVVPAGTVDRLANIESVEWRWLGGPDRDVHTYDGLVADFRAELSDDWERLLADKAIAGVPVYHVKQIEESITGRVQIEQLSENNFGSLIPGLAYIEIKQWLDFAAAVVAAILLLPLLIFIALLIKLDSPGPVLFRQVRMGYRGQPFEVFKFRTMRHVESANGSPDRTEAMTVDGDPRITRIGGFLRRTRIDEIPQLVNIIRGEMSWIGPRPEALVLSDWYESGLPFYRYRHIVRPGITGWAQVNQGHVTDMSAVNGKLQYDFYYIKYFSPWLDALIALRTVRILFTGIGAR